MKIRKINLNRLQGRFAYLVRQYMKKNHLTQEKLSKQVGIRRAHLAAMLTNHTTRPLTAYYLLKFIKHEIFSISEIYDEKPQSNREADFWNKARIVTEIGKNVDIENVLKLL